MMAEGGCIMVDPENVRSPKSRLSGEIEVLFNNADQEEYGYSIARFEWDRKPAVGIRWNGAKSDARDIGNPQSRGLPTWFILPEDVETVILDHLGVKYGANTSSSHVYSSRPDLEARLERVEQMLQRLVGQQEAQ
jgi:hypothetical protein